MPRLCVGDPNTRSRLTPPSGKMFNRTWVAMVCRPQLGCEAMQMIGLQRCPRQNDLPVADDSGRQVRRHAAGRSSTTAASREELSG